MAEITGDRGGRPVPSEYFDRLRRRIEESWRTELRAISGVLGTLGALRIPACIASSSHPAKLRLGLEATGLHGCLQPNVISASAVAHGKPAPDVFIYAAGWMRASVGDCVVVEDSVHGVRAAVAAGRGVIGFAGGAHCGPDHAPGWPRPGRHRSSPGATHEIFLACRELRHDDAPSQWQGSDACRSRSWGSILVPSRTRAAHARSSTA